MKPTFHRRHRHPAHRRPGFALVVTLSLLILMVLIATGLLSLSAISLRSSTLGEAQHKARANARLAVMMAIAELQKHAGDDRRITADASIDASAGQPDLLGVWKSWSPDFTSNPAKTMSSNAYAAAKSSNFLSWLVSHPDPALIANSSYAGQSPSTDSIEVFRDHIDGIQINASPVPVPSGSYAWAVAQEATRAKINVGGEMTGDRDPNDLLQAQARPNLALSDSYSHPQGDWNSRSARVISFNQANLDGDLINGNISAPLTRTDYSVQSMGLLTDVVNGGLKTDLSLGFELSDSDFDSANLGDFPNPFHYSGGPDYGGPVRDHYDNQRPLFRPLVPPGTSQPLAVHSANLSFWPANVRFDFPVAAVPTFHTLRSFYRTPYHLYTTNDGLTVFERGTDHAAIRHTPVPGGHFPPPAAIPEGEATRTGYRPVVDRVMFLLAVGLSEDGQDHARLIYTPIVTLWNPYNVALEIEGAVAYPWVDIPFGMNWTFYNSANQQVASHGLGMSTLMGYQFRAQGHGRSVDPYFFAALTNSGTALPQSGSVTPIRMRPGEVRVFAPTSPNATNFTSDGSIRSRTVFLRPVDSPSQLSTRGGLSVPTFNHVRSHGFTRRMNPGDSVSVSYTPATGEDYPFYISLEDATRARGTNPGTEDRGEAIADVLVRNFSRSGSVTSFNSPRITYAAMKSEPVPFGVLEVYHRVARSSAGSQAADLVYTGNPRQPWMNNYIVTGARFESGPQYEIRMRSISSFSGLLETGDGGRNAFYGASQSISTGRSQLSFFEVPRAPLLSLAAFQHADLTATPFAPANQFANSWASAYVPRSRASALNARPPMYDTVYLANEALWDGFFFSGAAPTVAHTQGTGSADVWNNPVANIRRSLDDVVSDFVRQPTENPLRNPRMRLRKGGLPEDDLIDTLLSPEGCVKIAAHLMLDGAFNVNSTSVEAWTAVLAGLRGADFEVTEGTPPGSSATAFPRFRNPIGEANDHWHGFRTLTDEQIKELAENIVAEVRERGPFLSLGEFVNRRIAGDTTALRGAMQAAIDATTMNEDAQYDVLLRSSYPAQSSANLMPSRTGVGIPGFLTQADVLQSLAPVLTVRSDTFTIRGYGEARDSNGRVLARAWCEAIVQRTPDYVDPTDDAYTTVSDATRSGEPGYTSRGTSINQTFGRRFSVVSLRYMNPSELPARPS